MSQVTFRSHFSRVFGLTSLALALMMPSVMAMNEIIAPHHHDNEAAAYPHINYGNTIEHAKHIKNGEYLVTLSDCVACHTDSKNHGQRFAGGLGIATPFGTIYAPNITPDKKTGIGSWTDAQFIRAMREGISPNGEYYFPVFPYVHFNKMSEKDILDIRLYLNHIPAMHQVNKAPDMPFPFRLRELQFFWRELFFHPHQGQWHPNPNQSKTWNRGQYIVEGPGHCGMCHTPINIMGGQLPQFAYTGGFVDGFHAPNISASGLDQYPTDKVLRVFLHGERLAGGQISGPMAEANSESLSFLAHQDLKSMVVFLKTVKSELPPQPSHSDSIDDATGKRIYGKYCTGCHTTGAGGAPKRGDAAAWAERLKPGIATVQSRAIHGYKGMPAKGGCTSCSEAEIKAATLYLAQPNKTSGSETPGTVITPPPKALSLADGKQIYETRTCHLCHESGTQGAPIRGDKTAWAKRIAQNMDVLYAHAIRGFNNMPMRGACVDCTDAEIMAATKYMVQQSKRGGDYKLW